MSNHVVKETFDKWYDNATPEDGSYGSMIKKASWDAFCAGWKGCYDAMEEIENARQASE
jgi:hypothetical protein